MAIYKVFGLLIDSDIPLPSLGNYQGEMEENASLAKLRRRPYHSAETSQDWKLDRVVVADPRGKNWFLYKNQGDSRYLIEYDGLLQFTISGDGRTINYALNREGLFEFFQWTFLHLALPFVLHLQSVSVYHASAVSVGAEALLFFGHSGQGKSTLSAAFARAGYPVITDDILVLEEKGGRFQAIPSLPWIRLCEESFDAVLGESERPTATIAGDGKLRVDSQMDLLPFAREPIPVRGMYVLTNRGPLADSVGAEISPVKPAEAVGVLLGRDSILPLLHRDQIASVFSFLGRLTRLAPAWWLTLPQELDRLPDVVSAIVSHQEGVSHQERNGAHSFVSSQGPA